MTKNINLLSLHLITSNSIRKISLTCKLYLTLCSASWSNNNLHTLIDSLLRCFFSIHICVSCYSFTINDCIVVAYTIFIV